VIVNIYGGPAAQIVVDEWPQGAGASGLFAQILTRDGFAVLSVDNRGTPNRGKNSPPPSDMNLERSSCAIR
jgi:dipeptidyl-peptidase 4